jgi:hypothetical protein
MFSDKIVMKIKTHVLCSIPFLRKSCRLWVTYLHTYSMQQSPSWEVNRFSIIQEITAFYGTRRFVAAFKIVLQLSLFWGENVEKYGRGGKATNNNMTHAHSMVCAWGYKYTLRICYTYCFSTATVVVRTRLSVKITGTLPVLFVILL